MNYGCDLNRNVGPTTLSYLNKQQYKNVAVIFLPKFSLTKFFMTLFCEIRISANSPQITGWCAEFLISDDRRIVLSLSFRRKITFYGFQTPDMLRSCVRLHIRFETDLDG